MPYDSENGSAVLRILFPTRMRDHVIFSPATSHYWAKETLLMSLSQVFEKQSKKSGLRMDL